MNQNIPNPASTRKTLSLDFVSMAISSLNIHTFPVGYDCTLGHKGLAAFRMGGTNDCFARSYPWQYTRQQKAFAPRHRPVAG